MSQIWLGILHLIKLSVLLYIMNSKNWYISKQSNLNPSKTQKVSFWYTTQKNHPVVGWCPTELSATACSARHQSHALTFGSRSPDVPFLKIICYMHLLKDKREMLYTDWKVLSHFEFYQEVCRHSHHSKKMKI